MEKRRAKINQVLNKLDKKKVVILKEIDLSLAKEHECPGIKESFKTQYLALIDNTWRTGSFTRVWFGLIFECHSHSIQFDAPNSNSSTWKRLYEIIYE